MNKPVNTKLVWGKDPRFFDESFATAVSDGYVPISQPFFWPEYGMCMLMTKMPEQPQVQMFRGPIPTA
jgi:hypothetical protein